MTIDLAPPPRPSATVVVCAFTLERWDDLVAAIDSISTQSPAASQVVLVIDHNDELLARATAHWPAVAVIPSSGAPGLSGARNTGVAAATGELVAFLDDDARAEPGWLEGLLEPYRDPRVVATGGFAEAAWDEGRPRWFPAEFDWIVGCGYAGLPTTAALVRNPIGSSMSFRAEPVRAAGGFRIGIGRLGTVPAGGEETELCIRLRQGHPERRIIFVPTARVRHRVRAARGTWTYFKSRCYQEGRSKAAISAAVGTEAALASERQYASRVLPSAILRGAGETLRGDPFGLVRSAVIAAGLAITTAGYVAGRLGR